MENDLEKSLEEEAINAPPMFHPVHERSEKAWLPSNEAASLAVLISHAWEDLDCLLTIRGERNGEQERRLLFKYALVELRSIVEQLEKLQSIIFQVADNRTDRANLHGRISKEEEGELRILFKEYHSIKKLVEDDLVAIRNKIGAHRGVHPWNEIMALWDKIEPESFRPLFKIVQKLFEHLRKLDIYDWSRIPEKGTIEICCSGLNDILP
jgi:hypothetical protein